MKLSNYLKKLFESLSCKEDAGKEAKLQYTEGSIWLLSLDCPHYHLDYALSLLGGIGRYPRDESRFRLNEIRIRLTSAPIRIAREMTAISAA